MEALLQAIVLGVIEGLTEFLPISSTGHLIIAEKYMNFRDQAKIFTVVIQVGAIAAVVWYYRSDIWQKIKGIAAGEQLAQRFLVSLVIATIPAGLFGLALDKHLEEYATPLVVSIALILGGVVLWLVDSKPATKNEHQKLELESISFKQAVLIGLAQCLALVPGVSRSGASIVGGLLSGLNRVTATGFSFYLGIPLLSLASAYKLAKDWDKLGSVSGGGSSIIVGLIVSFIVALLAVRWLLGYISTHNFKIFAYYRIVLGIIILLLLEM